MKKFTKSNAGFSLTEIIIVVALIALLTVGAVAAYGGVQRNARLTALHNDASALATAMNNFNAQAAQGNRLTIGPPPNNFPNNTLLTVVGVTTAVGAANITPTSITLIVPASGVRGEARFDVHFETVNHRDRAIRSIMASDGHFRVDSDAVIAEITN